MNNSKTKITLIGAGNVATRLGLALQKQGYSVVEVYSRTRQAAEKLAQLLGDIPFTDRVQDLNPATDLLLFSVKDDALRPLLQEIKPLEALYVHTAGSVAMEVFEGYARRYGVLYPLQTFTKSRETDLSSVPFFIEANNEEDEQQLRALAGSLSEKVITLPSEKRKALHLAAVFACNFTNHLYTLAGDILAQQNLPFELLLPLIEETAAKVKDLHPQDAQTGPAVRYDRRVIDKHLEMLQDDETKSQLYRLLSDSIHKSAQ